MSPVFRSFTTAASTDFELNLSTLSFGPVLEYARGPWAITVSTGLTINFASWDMNQRETLFVSRNAGPSTGSLDLSGWSLGVGVGFGF